ncbi:MAG: hypothetical protein ROO71_06515 [Balneola sp.]
MKESEKINPSKIVSQYFELLGSNELEICHDALGPLIDLSKIEEFSVLGEKARFLKASEIAKELNKYHNKTEFSTLNIYEIIEKRLQNRTKYDNLLVANHTVKEMVTRGAPLTIFSSVRSEKVWKQIVCFTAYHYIGIRPNPTSIQIPEIYFRNIRYIWINNNLEGLKGRAGKGSIIPLDDHLERHKKNKNAEVDKELEISSSLNVDHATAAALQKHLSKGAYLYDNQSKSDYSEGSFLDRFLSPRVIKISILIFGIVITLLATEIWEYYLPETTHVTVKFSDLPADATLDLNGEERNIKFGEDDKKIHNVFPGVAELLLDIENLRPLECKPDLPRVKESDYHINSFDWEEYKRLFPPDQSNKVVKNISCSLES